MNNKIFTFHVTPSAWLFHKIVEVAETWRSFCKKKKQNGTVNKKNVF